MPRQEPFPIGAEGHPRAIIDGQFLHLSTVADAPDLDAARAVRAGRQPFPVRADGHVAAVVERPHLDRPLGSQDMGVTVVCHSDDPAQPVLRRFHNRWTAKTAGSGGRYEQRPAPGRSEPASAARRASHS